MKTLKVLFFIVLVSLYSCGESKYPELEDGLYAEIITEGGNIVLNLEFELAPATVGNFVSLAEGTNKVVTDSMKGKPFYDGLKFHRVMSAANGDQQDFMIQGGCPLGLGTGDPGYKFADEFPLDSLGNYLLRHSGPGVLSMANGGPNSNGSQFFITLTQQPHLDGVHSVFGNVVLGQDVAYRLKKDTEIIEINIIRVGRAAKNFKAYSAFQKLLEKTEILEKKKAVLEKEAITNFLELKKKALELSPDFKIYFSKKGDGAKPELESSIRIAYAAYFTDGRLLDSNMKDVALKYGVFNANKESKNGYAPFPSTYSMNEQLIQGFKEGLQEMRFGDRAILFIPSHLAWGQQGGRSIPPNTDFIFEVEMFPSN